MKRLIYSANLIRYNANTSGKNTEDCVVRSISLAFDVPYTQVRKELNAILKENRRYDSYKYPSVYSKLITKYGGSTQTKLNPPITLDEFADTYDGSYVVETAKSPEKRTNHAVAVVDNEIYDSWDSSTQYAKYYFKTNKQHKAKTDILDHIDELSAYAIQVTNEYVQKYYDKYNFYKYGIVCDIDNKTSKKNYAFSVTGVLYPDGKYDESIENEFRYLPRYDISIAYVLTPTTTFDEATNYIDANAKQKLYDRFWTINKDIKSRIEAQALKESANIPEHRIRLYGGTLAKRFYHSLPAWAKPFITAIRIDRPGSYSDSYQVTMYPLPDDPNKDEVTFEFYDAGSIRDMLATYYKTFQRPRIDYDPYEIY